MKIRLTPFLLVPVATVLCLLSATSATAIVISPVGTTFGSLSAATFGGSGIPNDAVQITTIGNLTLGLTATPRYSNPAVTNNGAGTFFASLGGDIMNGMPSFAEWNFDFYVNGLGAGQNFKLVYDNVASVGNDVTTSFTGTVDSQDSWNLGMGFLNGGVFNPNTIGEYGFALVAYQYEWVAGQGLAPNWVGHEIGRSSIIVNVGDVSSVPDSGNLLLLLCCPLGWLALLRRRMTR